MKILQLIKEEIVPLSRKQNIVLFTIIACIFQFILFYAPALAAESVKTVNAQAFEQDMLITNDSLSKDLAMDSEAAKIKPMVSLAANKMASSSDEIASSSNSMASSSEPVASSTKPIASSSKEIVVKTSTHTMTAYNSEVGQTDDSPCITANGFNVCKHGIEDTVAANFLPMGTKIKIPELFGDRVFIVRDRMNKKHPNRVDVWMKDRPAAMKFGVKVAKIQILK